MIRELVAACLFTAFACLSAGSQDIDLGAGAAQRSNKRQHVELLSDALKVVTGKPQDVEILFRVDPGFHINSHQPKDELLVPTTLKLLQLENVQILSTSYPGGHPFKVSVGSETEILDAYTGEFRISLRLTAPRGMSKINGMLHYQACDNAACFPPRDLPVAIMIAAR